MRIYPKGVAKMKCNQVLELLPRYLSGELAGKEWDTLRRHLGLCKSCREEMESMETDQREVREALNYEAERCLPSKDYWPVLQQSIDAQRERQPAAPSHGRFSGISGMSGFFKSPWKLVPAAAVLVAVVVTLSLVLPPLFGNDAKVMAKEIALNSPIVQTALGGSEIQKIGVTSDSGTISRVVVSVSPEKVVIAVVDVKLKQVVDVKVQNLSDITEQQILDIARDDNRVNELLNKGWSISVKFADLIDADMIENMSDPELLQLYGINNPQDCVGFLALVMVQSGSDADARYLVSVNASSGKVVGFAQDSFLGGTVVVSTVTSTSPVRTVTISPTMVFVAPDPESINGEEPTGVRSYRALEQTSRRIVLALLDGTTNRQYCTYTWDVTDADIQKAIELARGDAEVQALLNQGARFVSFQAGHISGGTSQPVHAQGIMWSADIRIDLGDSSYMVTVDLSSGRTMGVRQMGHNPNKSPLDIMLP
jgi:hypothetical protein